MCKAGFPFLGMPKKGKPTKVAKIKKISLTKVVRYVSGVKQMPYLTTFVSKIF